MPQPHSFSSLSSSITSFIFLLLLSFLSIPQSFIIIFIFFFNFSFFFFFHPLPQASFSSIHPQQLLVFFDPSPSSSFSSIHHLYHRLFLRLSDLYATFVSSPVSSLVGRSGSRLSRHESFIFFFFSNFFFKRKSPINSKKKDKAQFEKQFWPKLVKPIKPNVKYRINCVRTEPNRIIIRFYSE